MPRMKRTPSQVGHKCHACAFFGRREEEYAAMLPFLKEGLAAGEKVLQIIDGRERAPQDDDRFDTGEIGESSLRPWIRKIARIDAGKRDFPLLPRRKVTQREDHAPGLRPRSVAHRELEGAIRRRDPEHLFLHTAAHYGFWHTHGVALRRLWDLALIADRLIPDHGRLQAEAHRCGASRLLDAALGEIEVLRSCDAGSRAELSWHLRRSDDLWAPLSPRERLRARAALLDGAGQRLTLLRYALLPPREETANATGCRSMGATIC